MDRERVGRRIKAFRKLKGYTQAELAQELNLPIITLGKLERGQTEPSEERLDQIARHLQIPRQELINSSNGEKED
ncbi:helix-turn-helix domain-containing protein [Lentibacillus juripiscarius]|uniref:Helix-turn-helix domain-containing protein n=1 Tax=Lentibacillus juripiscarius TaxID=257446 RepID=A0ABW5V6W6_9BACI